jgi:hypothetical protein
LSTAESFVDCMIAQPASEPARTVVRKRQFKMSRISDSLPAGMQSAGYEISRMS